MRCDSDRDVIKRCCDNPLISLADLPFACSDIWNAGVIHFDGQYLLLITIETLEGSYAIYQARSTNGVHFDVNASPFMTSLDNQYERVGIRDPRITPINGGYYITYVADGDHGLRLGVAYTEDFSNVKRLGYISQVDVKNGILFPGKIRNRHALLSRPDAGSSIWLGYSEDLEFWGDETVVLTPRGGYWDSHRVGPAAPPIEVAEGWLLIYYGEKGTSAGPLVRLGAAILDRNDPSRVIARSNIPILSPRERYERVGDVPNVVFSCGVLLEEDILRIYYGASDSCICRGSAPLQEIVELCFQSQREF